MVSNCLVANILSHRYNSRRARERRRLKVMRPPMHNPTKPYCFLARRASNLEASHTNVSEETLCTWQPWLACTAPGPPQDIPTSQPLPNPDDARPIVRRPTDLPVMASYDRAWSRTQSLWWHSWCCSTAPLTTAPPGKQQREHPPIHIDGTVVERVVSFKFLCVHITDKLNWSTHTDSVVKKAQQHLFNLRRL